MNDCRTRRGLARALATVAIATAALGGFAASAGATFPGENGLLAFTSGGLHVTDSKGRVSTLIHPIGPAPLWHYPTDPEFLPDGERIAYAYDGDILVSRTDGTERVNLTGDEQTAGEPAPSPTGEIAFTKKGSGFAGQDLFVMDDDGSDVRQITSGAQDKDPGWSPDGDRIVFTRTAVGEDGYLDGASAIYAVDPDGTDLTQLVAPGQPYLTGPTTFTPEGDHILFLRSDLLYRMNEDGTNVQLVVDPDRARDLRDVVASPDGSRLAFSRTFYSLCDMWGCYEDDSLIVSAMDGSRARTLREGGYLPGIDWGPAPEGGLPKPEGTCDGRDADIVGTPLPDEITGTKDANVIAGMGGEDAIRAGHANDRVCGGVGAQSIVGDLGRDLLIPGPGHDRVVANEGADSVSLRDGDKDSVGCGGGRDLVRADRIDEVARNCERVRY
jgi:WD40-like Beta Propeller Repeat/RTX calcium-binding nonapeptide repeat (4 copies)